MTLSAVQLAEKQLDAYNNHDLDLFCACFSDDVEVELLVEGDQLIQGMIAFRESYADRFSHPDLHAKLLNRIAVGRVVIDEEEVTGLGDDILHVMAIYEIEHGVIKKVRFERASSK